MKQASFHQSTFWTDWFCPKFFWNHLSQLSCSCSVVIHATLEWKLLPPRPPSNHESSFSLERYRCPVEWKWRVWNLYSLTWIPMSSPYELAVDGVGWRFAQLLFETPYGSAVHRKELLRVVPHSSGSSSCCDPSLILGGCHWHLGCRLTACGVFVNRSQPSGENPWHFGCWGRWCLRVICHLPMVSAPNGKVWLGAPWKKGGSDSRQWT